MVRLIGDVQTRVLRDGHSARIIKLARAAAAFAPDVQQLARGTVDRKPVRIDRFTADRRREVTEIDIARTVERDAAGVGQHRNESEQFALAVESLHAMVVMIRDQDHVRPIDGDTDRKMKFPGLRPLLSPGQNETDFGKLSLRRTRQTDGPTTRATTNQITAEIVIGLARQPDKALTDFVLSAQCRQHGHQPSAPTRRFAEAEPEVGPATRTVPYEPRLVQETRIDDNKLPP